MRISAAAVVALLTTSLVTAQGSVRSYGSGCPGSRGTPTIAFAGSPVAGASVRIDLTSAAINQPAILLMGLSDQRWALGPLPFDLGIYPQFPTGCFLRTSIDGAILLRTDAVGAASIAFTLPPTSAGARLFMQFACVENATRWTVSNALAITIGPRGSTVQGTLEDGRQNPVAGARVTLFDPSLSLFLETRSDAQGTYRITDVPAGSYRLGMAARDFAYLENGIRVAGPVTVPKTVLSPETDRGRWSVIGNTLPETFDATDMALLMDDGRIWFCHDTVHPIIYDPVTNQKIAPNTGARDQGCFHATKLADGRILIMGGSHTNWWNAVSWVKIFDPKTLKYTIVSSMLNPLGRFYPGMARLADGTPLIIGGGERPSVHGSKTCEVYDLQRDAWSYTGSLVGAIARFSPSKLLYTGEVLCTWFPPQLYNPQTRTWRFAGNFVQRNRRHPDDSDHSMVILSDGRALAIGFKEAGNNNPVMGEIYDPATDKWSLTSNPGLPRMQSEVVQLPDGRVLVAGGESAITPIPVPSKFDNVKWTDIYDPATDTWRRMVDMLYFREYHAVTVLVPDGRVVMTGGTTIKFRNPPVTADIEAFEPPYLFRGVRPVITSLSSKQLQRGGTVTVSVSPATAITKLVLMGTGETTHWVDGGIPRHLVLPVAQTGPSVTATLPTDPNVLPLGHYLLFAMVDDIPSVAKIVLVR